MPAISVPFKDTGVQIMAKRNDEKSMFSIASVIEMLDKEGK